MHVKLLTQDAFEKYFNNLKQTIDVAYLSYSLYPVKEVKGTIFFKVTSSLLGQALIFHYQEWYYQPTSHPQLPQFPDGHIVNVSRLTITLHHSAFLQIRLETYLSKSSQRAWRWAIVGDL